MRTRFCCVRRGPGRDVLLEESGARSYVPVRPFGNLPECVLREVSYERIVYLFRPRLYWTMVEMISNTGVLGVGVYIRKKA